VNDSTPRKVIFGGSRWMARALQSAERELSKLQAGLSTTRRLHVGPQLLGSMQAGAPFANALRQSATSLVPDPTDADRVGEAPLSDAIGTARSSQSKITDRNGTAKVASTLVASEASTSTNATRYISNSAAPRNLANAPGKHDAAAPRRVTLTMGRQAEIMVTAPAPAPHASFRDVQRYVDEINRPSWQRRSGGEAAGIAATATVMSPPASPLGTIGRRLSSSTETASPESPANATQSFAPMGTSRDGATQGAPGVAGIQLPSGNVFSNSGAPGPATGLTAQPQPAPNDSNAPSAVGPTEGDVYLDGTLMGRWIMRALTQAASRQPSGSAAFDSTRSRLPAGAMIGV
jgi:hypothetical protein